MKTFELNGTARTIAERSSEQARALKAIRKDNGVPCVLYGGGKNINFTVKADDLRKLVYTPHIYVVNLTIDGELHTAIMKELQFHPVKDNILHIDFLEINEQKPIVMEVPVKLQGLAEGVKAGGKMKYAARKAKVKGLYTNLPETVKVDVSDLDVEQSIKVSDIKVENCHIVDPQDALVCRVIATRASKSDASKDDDKKKK